MSEFALQLLFDTGRHNQSGNATDFMRDGWHVFGAFWNH